MIWPTEPRDYITHNTVHLIHSSTSFCPHLTIRHQHMSVIHHELPPPFPVVLCGLRHSESVVSVITPPPGLTIFWTFSRSGAYYFALSHKFFQVVPLSPCDVPKETEDSLVTYRGQTFYFLRKGPGLILLTVPCTYLRNRHFHPFYNLFWLGLIASDSPACSSTLKLLKSIKVTTFNY